jgi:hypothetical protein
MQNTANITPYVAPSGARIPLVPLIVALYFDADPGLAIGNRTSVSFTDFAADFNFSQQEIAAYFDTSITHPLNAALSGAIGASPVASTQLGSDHAPTTLPPSAPSGSAQPILGGTPAPPPNINNGWDAEQYVAAALTAAGWTAHPVSRQQLGYDIFAQRGLQRRYIEVKSSLGPCSPLLTAREWQQAAYHSINYVLAVLENFSPTGMNIIHWVPDPASRCAAKAQTTISHAISRTSWIALTVPVHAI